MQCKGRCMYEFTLQCMCPVRLLYEHCVGVCLRLRFFFFVCVWS